MYFFLIQNTTETKFSISTLVAAHFLDNPKKYRYVMHIDENDLNNNVENLKWACLNDYRLLKNKKLKLEQIVSTSSDEDDWDPNLPKGRVPSRGWPPDIALLYLQFSHNYSFLCN